MHILILSFLSFFAKLSRAPEIIAACGDPFARKPYGRDVERGRKRRVEDKPGNRSVGKELSRKRQLPFHLVGGNRLPASKVPHVQAEQNIFLRADELAATLHPVGHRVDVCASPEPKARLVATFKVMLVLCAETVLIRIQHNRKTQTVFVHRIGNFLKIKRLLSNVRRTEIVVKETSRKIRQRGLNHVKRQLHLVPHASFCAVGYAKGNAFEGLELFEVVAPWINGLVAPTNHAVVRDAHQPASFRLIHRRTRPDRALGDRPPAHVGMMPPHPQPVPYRRSVER